jgi:hypothetical protein
MQSWLQDCIEKGTPVDVDSCTSENREVAAAGVQRVQDWLQGCIEEGSQVVDDSCSSGPGETKPASSLSTPTDLIPHVRLCVTWKRHTYSVRELLDFRDVAECRARPFRDEFHHAFLSCPSYQADILLEPLM